jgi:hypothetical protein
MARWQSGYAAACKAADIGSIPFLASNFKLEQARVAELVDAADLKSVSRKRVRVRFPPRAPGSPTGPKKIPTACCETTFRANDGRTVGAITGCPCGRRMFCDVEVQDSPTIMTQDYQHEQDPERRRRGREEIQGNQLFGMVPKKRSPSLGRRPPMLNHVLGYGGY